MAYCDSFLEELKQMNFSRDIGTKVRQVLLRATYSHVSTSAEALAAFTATWGSIDVSTPLSEDDFDLALITEFAGHFRNIQHLSQMLEEAPPQLKALQTKLAVAVLLKLDSAQKEMQFLSLSINQIQQLLKQAIQAYDETSDAVVRSHYQHLVQMGVFELVRRHCEVASVSAARGYDAYKQSLDELNAKLEDVKTSTILDSMSEYQTVEGLSVTSMLDGIEKTFLEGHPVGWAEEAQGVFESKASLFHKLRFGQDDRREYVRKRADALARDLFWARGIRDVELFTKSPIADAHWRELAERRYFSGEHPFQLDGTTKPAHKKLLKALTDFSSRPGSVDKNVREALKGYLKTEFNAPYVKYTSGQFDVTFFTLGADFFTAIFAAMHGKTSDYIKTLPNNINRAMVEAISAVTQKGASLAKIEQALRDEEGTVSKEREDVLDGAASIGGKSGPTRSGSSTGRKSAPGLARSSSSFCLTALKIAQAAVTVPSISEVVSNSNEELRLRKLLELYVFFECHSIPRSIPGLGDLVSAFEHLQNGEVKSALETRSLDDNIEKAYAFIASLPISRDMDERMVSIIHRAQLLYPIHNQRTEKLAVLSAIVEGRDAVGTRTEALSQLFLAEYLGMQETLNYSAADKLQLERDIRSMASEFVRLDDRVSRGIPAITTEEQAAYFQLMKTLVSTVPAEVFLQGTFKVPHSCFGRQAIFITPPHGEAHRVMVDLQHPLPYSLVKPPGSSDVFLSYGGSRGIVAPFKDFHQAYRVDGPKRRFFTRWRLPGVGQSGSVKELESLSSGLHQVIKQGYTAKLYGHATFRETARNDLLTRGITSRNAPLSRVESDVLQHLARAEQSNASVASPVQYWQTQDKERPEGRIFGHRSMPEQYHLLMRRAKGDTYADTSNQRLDHYLKRDPKYHNPTLELELPEAVRALNETLALSGALVSEAQRVASLKFIHNDLKPENMVYQRHADGHYTVRFIDWETGGFESIYTGDQSDISRIFIEVFGEQNISEMDTDVGFCLGEQGRFVKRVPDPSRPSQHFYTFGIKPTLEILHGAFNGTLPYISPHVLSGAPLLMEAMPASRQRRGSSSATSVRATSVSKTRPIDTSSSSIEAAAARPKSRPKSRSRAQSVSKSRVDPVISTVIELDDPRMDDWALMVMVFGVCNRNAYFRLVKGRVVADYEIPGILESDGASPRGLNIVNPELFEAYFGCGDQAAMYVPSNQREGEPLHLFRRLQGLKEACANIESAASLSLQIERILTEVLGAVSSGQGLSKEKLQALLHEAKQCIIDFELLQDAGYQQRKQYVDRVQAVLESQQDINTHNSLLRKEAGDDKSVLELLCTYSNETQREAVLSILDRTITLPVLQEQCFDLTDLQSHGPWYLIFVDCIAAKQNAIMMHLLQKVNGPCPDFITLVREQGLLHYALQEGMTDVAVVLLNTLKTAGATTSEIAELMFREYTERSLTYLHWSNNAFHAAIRNADNSQLNHLLEHLVAGKAHDDNLWLVLYWCATFSNPMAFKAVLDRYNTLNPGSTITPAMLLNKCHPPRHLSIYHLFLQNERALEGIHWGALEGDASLAKQFLLEAPSGTSAFPLLMVAEKENLVGLKKLLLLAQRSSLSVVEYHTLFLQKDVHGKNILHHLLEKGQFDALRVFFDAVRTCFANEQDRQKVLMALLDNGSATAPLSLFLANHKNPVETHEVMGLVLNMLCEHHDKAMPIRSQNRYDVLKNNRTWLLAEAQSGREDELRALLQNNNALPRQLKRRLFDELRAETEAPPLYGQLVAEITTSRQPRHAAGGVDYAPLETPDDPSLVTTNDTLFETFAKSFAQAFARTNSTGIQQMKTYMTTLLEGKLSDDTSKFQRLSQEMQTIAKARTKSGLTNLWAKSGVCRGGRSVEVTQLYGLMQKDDFYLLNSWDQINDILNGLRSRSYKVGGLARFFCCHSSQKKAPVLETSADEMENTAKPV